MEKAMTISEPVGLPPDGFTERGGPPRDPVPAAMATDAGQR
jgi:hypothetical protein